LPSLQLKDVRIGEEMVHTNERMLTGGFYAEVELAYDPTIAQENNGRPFGIESLREIQLSKREVLPALYQGREAFATEEWKDFLIRSIGMEPEQLTRSCPGHGAAPHGPVRRAQLQHGGARPTRHR
jgi:ATP-dependent Lon protease